MSSQTHSDSAVLEKQKEATKPQEPQRYKVVIHNDDYTPFDFVIKVLMTLFGKSEDQAVQLAVEVHKQGKGICGVYVKDIAELKQDKVASLAKEESHPLLCTVEPENPAPRSGMRP